MLIMIITHNHDNTNIIDTNTDAVIIYASTNTNAKAQAAEHGQPRVRLQLEQPLPHRDDGELVRLLEVGGKPEIPRIGDLVPRIALLLFVRFPFAPV